MKKIIIFLFLSSLLLSSCAYFNTFFLAKKYYKLGFDYRKKDFYKKIESDENSNYTNSLKKSSFLFKYYSKSKWIDDALILVGKIYYFRSDYNRAITKFNELILGFPQSKLVTEAKLWKARTMIANDNLVKSEEILIELLKTIDNKKMKAEALFEMGNIFKERELYSIANDYYVKSTSEIPDFLEYYAYLYSGETFLKIKKYKEAIKNFNSAMKNTKDRKKKYSLTMKITETHINAGNYSKALKEIDQLINYLENIKSQYVDEKNFQYEIELKSALILKAYCYEKMKDYKTAINLYEDILTNYKNDKIISKAHYQLGEYYLNIKEDFKASSFNFQQVMNLKLQNFPLNDSSKQKSQTIDNILRIEKNLQHLDLSLKKESSIFFNPEIKLIHQLDDEMILKRLKIIDTTYQLLFPLVPNNTNLNEIKTRQEDIKMGKNYEWEIHLAEIYLLELNKPLKAVKIYKKILEKEDPSDQLKSIACFYLAWCYETYLFDNTNAQFYYNKMINQYYFTPFTRKILGLKMPDSEEKILIKESEILAKKINSLINENIFDSAYAYTQYWITHYEDEENQPRILFRLANLFNSLVQDVYRAEKLFADLEEKFPNNELTFALKQSQTSINENKINDYDSSDIHHSDTSIISDSLNQITKDSSKRIEQADSSKVEIKDSLSDQSRPQLPPTKLDTTLHHNQNDSIPTKNINHNNQTNDSTLKTKNKSTITTPNDSTLENQQKQDSTETKKNSNNSPEININDSIDENRKSTNDSITANDSINN